MAPPAGRDRLLHSSADWVAGGWLFITDSSLHWSWKFCVLRSVFIHVYDDLPKPSAPPLRVIGLYGSRVIAQTTSSSPSFSLLPGRVGEDADEHSPHAQRFVAETEEVRDCWIQLLSFATALRMAGADGEEAKSDLEGAHGEFAAGWMLKKGSRGLLRRWQRRWFELRGPYVDYFRDRHDTAIRGCFRLSPDMTAEEVSHAKEEASSRFEFVVRNGDGSIARQLRAYSALERRQWVDDLNRCIALLRSSAHLADSSYAAMLTPCPAYIDVSSLHPADALAVPLSASPSSFPPPAPPSAAAPPPAPPAAARAPSLSPYATPPTAVAADMTDAPLTPPPPSLDSVRRSLERGVDVQIAVPPPPPPSTAAAPRLLHATSIDMADPSVTVVHSSAVASAGGDMPAEAGLLPAEEMAIGREASAAADAATVAAPPPPPPPPA